MCCWPEAKALKKRYAIGNYTRALYRSSRIWAPAEPGSGDVQARYRLFLEVVLLSFLSCMFLACPSMLIG